MTSDYSSQLLCTETSRKNLLERTSAQKTVGMGMRIQAQKPGFIALRTRHRGAAGAERSIVARENKRIGCVSVVVTVCVGKRNTRGPKRY